MIKRTHFKINLGLSLLGRRGDGYTELESVMFPVLCGDSDLVELCDGDGSGVVYSGSGLVVDCPVGENLCVRAVDLMRARYGVGGGCCVHLHKQLPFGAGLGAGSANCAGVLCLFNDVYGLGLSVEELESLAAELGSDTSLFVGGDPMVSRGRGELLSPVGVDLRGVLRGYYLLLVKPPVGVSTAEAYAGARCSVPPVLPSVAVQRPVSEWRDVLHNAFEDSVFEALPVLGALKAEFYDSGAVYASMSGSGSTVYGLFTHYPGWVDYPADYYVSVVRL